MTLFFSAYRLVERGEAGLCCDDDGVTLGPIALVRSQTDDDGRRAYEVMPVEDLAKTIDTAFDDPYVATAELYGQVLCASPKRSKPGMAFAPAS